MQSNYAESAALYKVLSDETRLKIIDMLSCGELCACHILEGLNITQPTLSYHMKLLSKCGIVSAKKDGVWMKYSLNDKKSEEVKRFTSQLFSHSEDCICKPN